MSDQDLSSAVTNQIKILSQNLTKKNYRSNVSEIDKLLTAHGYEARRFLFKLLLTEINFQNIQNKDQFKVQLLAQEFMQLTTSNNFISFIVETLEGIGKAKGEFVSQISKVLGLTLSQQVMIGLGLSQSLNAKSQQEGVIFLKTKLPEILETGPTTLSDNIVHHFLLFISQVNEFSSEKAEILKSFKSRNNVINSPIFSEFGETTTPLSEEPIFTPSNLSLVFKEIGYVGTSSNEILTEIFNHFDDTTEQDIAQTLGMMVTTHTSLGDLPNTRSVIASSILENIKKDSKPPTTWNLDNFVVFLKKKFPKFVWKNIINQLDYPDFKLKDQKGFALLNSFYKKLEEKPFPIASIVGLLWKNRKGQLSILSMALDAPPDVVNFSLSSRKISTDFFTKKPNPTWNSLDLVETLLNLGESDNYKKVKKIFDVPIKQNPEQMLIVIAQSQTQNVPLQTELLWSIFPSFIKSHKTSYMVLEQLMNVNPQLFVALLAETYLKNPQTLTTILDIGQNLKCIALILETKQFKFAINLAIIASKRDHINLYHWLKSVMAKYQDVFVQEMVIFLLDRRGQEQSLTQEVTIIFLKCLQQYMTSKKNINPELAVEIQKIMKNADPKLTNDISTEYQIPEDIEKEASNFFENVFNKVISIDKAINDMTNLKNSKKPRDRQLYSCMIHNLFDEYRFFEQYPPTELQIVAKLFGAIINNGLIVAKSLRFGLIYVLQALTNPSNARMYQFGLISINEFKNRLHEWPQFCAHIEKLNHVLNDLPELVGCIEKASGSSVNDPFSNIAPKTPEKLGREMGSSEVEANIKIQQLEKGVELEQNVRNINAANVKTPNSKKSLKNSFGKESDSENSWNVDPNNSFSFSMDISTLQSKEKDAIIIPDEKTADKLHFIVNNLSSNNVVEKCVEIKKILSSDHYGYLASYIVVNRVSLEPNYHTVYKLFLEKMTIPTLEKLVIKETYSNIHKLLDSDRITSGTSDSERTLLKNLGSWLGLFTIAMNKPILKKDLDLKQLIFNSYEQGKMIAVVPFVVKILNYCSVSKVIKPPNPWIMGVVSLLVDIHHIHNLKLNLKFEVEMLCKKLKLEINEIESKNQLDGKVVKVTPSPDFNFEKQKTIQQPQQPIQKPIQQPQQPQTNNQLPKKKENETSEVSLNIPELKNLVVLNEKFAFLNLMQLRMIVSISVDRAVSEILPPVVKRSSTIACRTTVELISKDFSLESDNTSMNKVINNMVKNLSSNLAMVTCKDALRFSIENKLLPMLSSTFKIPESIEKQISFAEISYQISFDNLDLACSIVVQAASERALIEIHESFREEIENKKKNHRIQIPHHIRNYGIPNELIPVTGLNSTHIQIYEEFSKLEPGFHGSQDNYQFESMADLEKIFIAIEELEKEAESQKVTSLLRSNNLKKKLMSIIGNLQPLCASVDNAVFVSERYIKKLFDYKSRLSAEVSLLILKCAKNAHLKNVLEKLTQCWINMDSEKKFNKEIVIEMLRTELILLNEFDAHVAKLIEDGNQFILQFAFTVFKICCLDQAFIPTTSMRKIVDCLAKRDPNILKFIPNIEKQEKQEDQVSMMIKSQFVEWCNIIAQPVPNGEEKKIKFIQQLQSTVLRTDADFEILCMILLDFSIENFLTTPKTISKNNTEQRTPREVLFRRIDAFSELVTMILKFADSKNKMNLFSKILTVSSKKIQMDHQKEDFNQRPYFRFLSNLLIDVNEIESSDARFPLLMLFGSMLQQLTPQQLPGFSFSWIELVSHRMFMPKLLFSKNPKGESQFHKLLTSLFIFLEPHLRKAELNDAVSLLYRGTLKILLVLLHDFSEFLCKYHFSLCNVIPPSCVQMRNLILSAFPRHMRLPDPFTPNLKVDKLPEIHQPPNIASNFTEVLEKSKIMESLDDYLKNRKSTTFLQELKSSLYTEDKKYDIILINSLVLYVGVKGISQLQVRGTSMFNNSAMDIFISLIKDLDTEGRYLLVNAIANQLRYPNNHTHYFSCILLYLFSEIKHPKDSEIVQEQITRVLLERLIVNRPHPWGLLITFIELVKNPRYAFWEKEFIRCAPEIAKLFENVGKSCISGQKTSNE
jgi:CCR4-NOT transcription complex subunit 1